MEHGLNYIERGFVSVLEQYHLRDKIKRMRQAGHTEKENSDRVFMGKPERKNHLKELDVDGRTILK